MPETDTESPTGDQPLLTVAQAAERLGVTLPRLMRALKREEFARHVRKAERPTRTGTRTVTLVSVSVLEDVRRWLDEQKHKQYGANHYRSEGEQFAEGTSLIRQLLDEREARLRDKDAEIQRLVVTLTETQEALAKALDAVAREQMLRALPAPTEPETPPADTAAEADEPAEAATEKPRRGFWQWLTGRG